MEKVIKNKGIFTAEVAENVLLGENFGKLTLILHRDGAKTFAKAQAGQFAELDLTFAAKPFAGQIPADLADKLDKKILLRRPFSFSDVRVNGTTTEIDILYCVLGPATLRMLTLKKGVKISIIGVLGNGFTLLPDKRLAILVAGGMGAPPLQHLAKEIRSQYAGTEIIAFAGAKSAIQLPYFKIDKDNIKDQPSFVLEEFTKYNVKAMLSTDDGSAGFKGFITELLSRWLDKNSPDAQSTVIYTCGPEVMMQAVAKIAAANNISCQVSMERMMACGTGLCQGCAIQCVDRESGENFYKLCCKDGPVFQSDEIVW